MKTLNYKTKPLSFEAPKNIAFENPFYDFLYSEVYNRITDNSEYEPIWDVDDIYNDISLRSKVIKLAIDYDEKIEKPGPKATNKDRIYFQHHIRHFLKTYPQLLGLFKHVINVANQVIENAEFLHCEKCNGDNFIELKKIIDEQNKAKWVREKDGSEAQSGKTVLGNISESLLQKVFSQLEDDKNFFKVNSREVKSYGDFVLISLPNNLWISVKSNFAKERLLASGFNTDIIGVGFFQEYEEFTSPVKIRNLQRAGFVGIYLPDVAVTDEQLNSNTSTFDELVYFYQKQKIKMPLNINGKSFFRKLSNLKTDFDFLLNEKNLKKRFTFNF
ncbi:hypothetical protein N9X49_03105 [Amylibacter sp.]|nr:hypothetical protein [Amylibacter sp.]